MEFIGYRNINYHILIDIEKWLEVDQFVRSKNDSCIGKYFNEVDSINCKNVINLINSKGFPGFNMLGIHSNDILFLIMHATTNYASEKYWDSYFKPLLLSEAKKGNISFSSYAFIFDRYYYYLNNKKQYYGLLKTSTREYLPIENIKEVDKRRAELGLPPLWMDSKISKIKLPDNYIK